MAAPFDNFLDDAEMIKNFRSLLLDGSTVETALLQVSFEEGCTSEEVGARLENLVGNLDEFALKDDF